MPRSTALRMSAIISCLSFASPYEKLMPMHPKPRAETSRLLFPSLRFCILNSLAVVSRIADCESGNSASVVIPGLEIEPWGTLDVTCGLLGFEGSHIDGEAVLHV